MHILYNIIGQLSPTVYVTSKLGCFVKCLKVFYFRERAVGSVAKKYLAANVSPCAGRCQGLMQGDNLVDHSRLLFNRMVNELSSRKTIG